MLPDLSVVAIIVLFFATVVAVDKILIQPLFKILDEREKNTKGLIDESGKTLEYYTELFNRYQNSIREARLAAYKLQEQLRAESLKMRSEIISGAKAEAEKLIGEAKGKLNAAVRQTKASFAQEVHQIADTISSLILLKQH